MNSQIIMFLKNMDAVRVLWFLLGRKRFRGRGARGVVRRDFAVFAGKFGGGVTPSMQFGRSFRDGLWGIWLGTVL